VAQKPANERLWASLGAQARAKYQTYPSPAASHWVHEQYVKYGGRFIDTTARAQAEKLGRQWQKRKEAMKAHGGEHAAAKDDKKK
jgi:hypothetical protein